MDSMFETLMDLPLFRGISREKMSEIVGMAKFNFLKYLPDAVFINSGDPVDGLLFMLSGSARLTLENADQRFKIAQTVTAPHVLWPQFLFGRSTQYPGTAVAIEPSNMLQVSKADYLKILTRDQVFMLNNLNFLSANAQNSIDTLLAMTSGTVQQRLALWVANLSQPDATDITLICRQRDLYSVFGIQRSSYIAAMDDLVEQGILSYTANDISILDRRALVQVLV